MKRLILAALPIAAASGCGTPPPSPGTVSAPPSSQIGRPVQTTRASRIAGSASRGATVVAPRPPAESEPVPRRGELPAAQRTARRFFRAYVRFLYRRLPAAEVPDAAPQLRSELTQSAALKTPAEGSSRPRIIRLTVRPAGPPISAIATATLTTQRGRYALTATLEPRHGRWIVVAIDG